MVVRTTFARVAGVAAVTLLGALSWARAGDPPGVSRERIDGTDEAHWRASGFVQLVAPIAPPTSLDGVGRIEIWLRLPDAGSIDVAEGEGGAPLLSLPVGSIVDRVEVARSPDGSARVLDVRGTELGPIGQRFHVYRPVGEALLGVSWPRGDAPAQAAADDALAGWVTPRQRERLVALNQCESCHGEAKRPNTHVNERGLPNRATDASGFYDVQAVLETALPVERSRPRDENLDHPFVDFACRSAVGPPAFSRTDDGAQHVACADRTVAWAELDLPAALAAGDAHAAEVCRSRRVLAARMTPRALQTFSDALMACGVETENASPKR